MTLHHHPQSPLLDHCPEGLPAHAYYDAAWYAAEQKAVWARNWVYAGRTSDLAPSTMRRLTVAGVSVILCRDTTGAITAFHNTCRHRGAELCAEAEKPLGKLITCPYHKGDNLWVEIYALRELQYAKLMLRVVPTDRPFFAPAQIGRAHV